MSRATGAVVGTDIPSTQPALDTFKERQRQRKLWGRQHHANGTGAPIPRWTGTAREQADFHRDQTNLAAKTGALTWAHILAEEFFEAMAEWNDAKLREELIQVAAVAQSWVEDIDSRPAARAA